MEHVLSSVIISTDGQWVWNGAQWSFHPLGEAILDTESKRNLFTVGAGVTGEIISYKVGIVGVGEHDWGIQAAVGQRYWPIITARYHASEKYQTGIEADIYLPDGTYYTLEDWDQGFAASPEEVITFQSFHVPGSPPPISGIEITMPGIWQAELRYLVNE